MAAHEPRSRCRPSADRREAEADAVARQAAAWTADEAGVRREVGALLARDFSGVRVRPGAADLEAEGAGAETRGDEIRVAPGHWRPDLPLGRALLAHELTHVAQQGAAPRLRAGATSRWGPGPGGYAGALAEARSARPSARLAARGATLAEPAVSGLTPAPRGMRQRTVSCTPTRLGPPQWRGRSPAPAPTPAPAPAPASTPAPAPATARPAPAAAPTEDWNFTPAEHGALRAGGGALSFASGSDWMPEPLRRNLLATLERLLDPALTPSATAGVNVRDFYHGHVVVPRGAMPAASRTALAAYGSEEERRYTAALGSTTGDVTAGNLEAFRQALRELHPFATRVLTPALAVPGAAVIYHTFEMSGPPMRAGDPRRNWRTPLDTNTPAPYDPPDPDNASSYERDYAHVFQFAFLVDSQGRIHVQPNSTFELRAVTGEPGGIL